MKNLGIIFLLSLNYCSFNAPVISRVFSNKLDIFWGNQTENSNDDFSTEDNPSLNRLGNNNMFNYFDNLTDNFGNNHETNASCGYVAIGMLLNYYDTFYNDNIVEEKYEVNVSYDDCHLNLGTTESPGTLFEQNSGLPYNSVNAYLNYLRNNYVESSLHAKLVLLGTQSLESSNFPSNSTYLGVLGLNFTDIDDVIDDYFDSFQNSFTYTIKTETQAYNLEMDYENVFDFIDEELDDGRPVLVGFGHHLRVAFHKANQMYYFHEGYKDTGNHTRICARNKNDIIAILQNPVFQETFHAISIEMTNMSNVNAYHYHSTVFNDDNTYNESFINHSSHYYVYNYMDYTVNKHRCLCKCGQYIEQQHLYLQNLHYPNEYCICGRRNPFYV